jgi:hypothetical protein
MKAQEYRYIRNTASLPALSFLYPEVGASKGPSLNGFPPPFTCEPAETMPLAPIFDEIARRRKVGNIFRPILLPRGWLARLTSKGFTLGSKS